MDDVPAIELRLVTRFYGRHRGVSDLTATIPRGAFVGLLGPNGSGKTTTLRVLSCCIPPTSGEARICGLDVFTQSFEVRRKIGYLPEHCPLYPEMRVLEYLRWTAEMKGLRGSDADRATFDVLGPCGLESVRRQPIRTLSRGYRQRVGVASVLLHRPEVVILDEPTAGLDPLQVREFRRLLGTFKGRQTVLISSHILSEIEMLCDSVIILHEGRVVANGAPETLRGTVPRGYRVECRAHGSLPVLLPRWLDRVPGTTLESYEVEDGFARIRLRGTGPDPRLELSRLLREAGIELRELATETNTLEEVFVHCLRKESVGGGSAPDPKGPAPGRTAA